MKPARIAANSRSRLDERFKQFGTPERYRAPARGWIRAVREALGMSTAQLANRMGIRQPSVVNIERSEEKATIQLATLRRAAEALDCHLVYFLVPNKPLQLTMHERARAFLRRRRDPIEHTMLLEDQQVNNPHTDALVEDVLRAVNPRLFWE